MTRGPLFVECQLCGERWKAASVPMDAERFSELLKGIGCPNWGAYARDVRMCPTDGPDAVTSPREGRDLSEVTT